MPIWKVKLVASKPNCAMKHYANLSSKLVNSQPWLEISDQMVNEYLEQLSNDSNSSDTKTSRQKKIIKLSSKPSPCKLPLQLMIADASQMQYFSIISPKNMTLSLPSPIVPSRKLSLLNSVNPHSGSNLSSRALLSQINHRNKNPNNNNPAEVTRVP